jgi:hypothetical protein
MMGASHREGSRFMPPTAIARPLSLAALLLAAALGGMLVQGMARAAPPATLSFKDKIPVMLDVAGIEVEDATPTMAPDPDLQQQLQITPADAVRLWASDKLKATGTEGKARLVVRDASLKQTHLKVRTGISGWFHKDQSERYDGHVSVELVVDHPARRFNGTASAEASRSFTIEEGTKVEQRRALLLKLVQDMLNDIDTAMDKSIRDSLFPVLIL